MSLLLALALLACERNACVEMCQEYKRWIDDCGSSWEAEFPGEGWHNVDDCYEAQWEASSPEQVQCDSRRRSYEKRKCY